MRATGSTYRVGRGPGKGNVQGGHALANLVKQTRPLHKEEVGWIAERELTFPLISSIFLAYGRVCIEVQTFTFLGNHTFTSNLTPSLSDYAHLHLL